MKHNKFLRFLDLELTAGILIIDSRLDRTFHVVYHKPSITDIQRLFVLGDCNSAGNCIISLKLPNSFSRFDVQCIETIILG